MRLLVPQSLLSTYDFKGLSIDKHYRELYDLVGIFETTIRYTSRFHIEEEVIVKRLDLDIGSIKYR